MRRCLQCVLPDNYPNIHFDSDGVCNFCLTYTSPSKYRGEEEVVRIISRARGNEHPYDCLVPWSGGRDSTYVLYNYKMVRGYKLKVLAFNYDNGFTSDQAKENIRRIAHCSAWKLRKIACRTIFMHAT
jgi:tRNA(Ile)-lysidine synthase TilS/MesJ